MDMKRRIFIKKFILMFIFFFFIPSTSQAENNSPHTLDLLIKETIDSNPEIISTKYAFESASARIPQSRSLNDPMIEFEYDRITADWMLTGDPMRSFSVNRDIPFLTKLYLRVKIVSKLSNC